MLKDWTRFEKIMLFLSIFIVLLVGIIFKSDVLTIICSLAGVTTTMLCAKGKSLGQVAGLIVTITYIFVAYRNRYFGEVLIYVFLMLPMFIAGIISWYRHENKKTNSVDVNEICKKEWIIIAFIFPIILVGIYFLLKVFNTSELIVSTISVIASLFAVYLQVKRSRYSFSFYMINDLVLLTLWGIPVVKGSLILIPMVVDPIFNFINDCYGFKHWKKLESEQKGE